MAKWARLAQCKPQWGPGCLRSSPDSVSCLAARRQWHAEAKTMSEPDARDCKHAPNSLGSVSASQCRALAKKPAYLAEKYGAKPAATRRRTARCCPSLRPGSELALSESNVSRKDDAGRRFRLRASQNWVPPRPSNMTQDSVVWSHSLKAHAFRRRLAAPQAIGETSKARRFQPRPLSSQRLAPAMRAAYSLPALRNRER